MLAAISSLLLRTSRATCSQPWLPYFAGGTDSATDFTCICTQPDGNFFVGGRTSSAEVFPTSTGQVGLLALFDSSNVELQEAKTVQSSIPVVNDVESCNSLDRDTSNTGVVLGSSKTILVLGEDLEITYFISVMRHGQYPNAIQILINDSRISFFVTFGTKRFVAKMNLANQSINQNLIFEVKDTARVVFTDNFTFYPRNQQQQRVLYLSSGATVDGILQNLFIGLDGQNPALGKVFYATKLRPHAGSYKKPLFGCFDNDRLCYCYTFEGDQASFGMGEMLFKSGGSVDNDIDDFYMKSVTYPGANFRCMAAMYDSDDYTVIHAFDQNSGDHVVLADYNPSDEYGFTEVYVMKAPYGQSFTPGFSVLRGYYPLMVGSSNYYYGVTFAQSSGVIAMVVDRASCQEDFITINEDTTPDIQDRVTTVPNNFESGLTGMVVVVTDSALQTQNYPLTLLSATSVKDTLQTDPDHLAICSHEILEIKSDFATLTADPDSSGSEDIADHFRYGCDETKDTVEWFVYEQGESDCFCEDDGDWIYASDGSISWDGTDEDAATFSAFLKIENAEGETLTYDFEVEYTTTNHACEYSGDVSFSVVVDESISIPYPTLSDENDGDTHSVVQTVFSAGGGLTNWIEDTGTHYVFAPDSNTQYDTYTITFTATDDNSESATEGILSCSIEIVVEVLWKNECPTFDASFTEGQTVAIKSDVTFPLEIEASDIDDLNIAKVVEIDGQICPINDKCSYSGTTVVLESPNEEGVFEVLVTREDFGAEGKGEICEITRTMTLIVQDGNKQPYFAGDIVSVEATEDVVFTQVLDACTDDDTWDTLTYSLEIEASSTVPDCFSFDSATRTLTYDNCATPGTFSGALTCTDDNFYDYDNGELSDVDTFDIIVLPINETPVCSDLTPDSYTTHSNEIRISFSGSYTDADDTVFHYSFIQEPGFLEIDGEEIVIYTKDNQFACATGSDQLLTTVIVEVLDDNFVEDTTNGQQSCQINLDLTLIALNLSPEFTATADSSYNLENDGRTESYTFEFEDEDVSDSTTFGIELVGSSLPAFISFTSTATSATVIASLEMWNVNQVGVWQFRAFIQDSNAFGLETYEQEFYFSLNIDGINHDVEFVELVEYFEMTVGETFQVTAPLHEDEDFNDSFEYKVLKDSYNWITPSGTGDTLYFAPVENEQSGSFTLGFQIEDSNSGQCSCGKSKARTYFDFTVYATDGTVGDNGNAEEEEEVEIATSLEELLGFTVKQSSKDPPKAKIIRIDTKGEVTIVFDQELRVFDQIEKFVNTQVLAVSLLPAYDGVYDPEDMLESWDCISLTSESMTLQLKLKTPLKISSYSTMDRLQVQFLVPFYFFSPFSQKTVEKGTTIRSQIPPQNPLNSAFSSMASASGSLNSASKAMVAVQFGINVILSASLNMIWSLMNTMQVMVHLPLMNLSFPQNAQSISEIFLSLANFDVVPHGYLNTKTFDFDETLKTKEVRFDLMGYGETNFILNAGTSFWLLIGWFSLSVFTIIITFIDTKSERFDNFRLKINKLVFFQLIIRIYLECYLELLVCSLINIKNLNWDLDGERMSSLFSCLIFVFLSVSPQALHYILTSNQRLIVMSKSLNERFGDLYEGFKCEQKHCLQYPYFFLLRRLILAYTVIFLAEYLFLQLSLTFICSTALILYFVHFKPYREPFMNQIELFNEFTILMLVYFLWGFTDNVSDPEVKWNFGLLYSAIIFFSLLINIGSLTYQTLKKPCKRKFKGFFKGKKKIAQKNLTLKEHNTTIQELLGPFTTLKEAQSMKLKKHKGKRQKNQDNEKSSFSYNTDLQKNNNKKGQKLKVNPLEDTQDLSSKNSIKKIPKFKPSGIQNSIQIIGKRKSLKQKTASNQNEGQQQAVFRKKTTFKKVEKLFIRKQTIQSKAQKSQSEVQKPKASTFNVSNKQQKNFREQIKLKKEQIRAEIEEQKGKEFEDDTIDFNQLKA